MPEPMWKVFPELVRMVREDHKAKNALVGDGHDFTHALMVAQYCLQITDEPIATLAWVAGICHNTDRHYGDQMVESMVNQYLACTNFSDQDKKLVLEAVLNHSHLPSSSDNPVTIILMDADKLGNLGWQVVVRSAQLQPHLPLINFIYLDQYPPGHNFKNPGSIYRDMVSVLEWSEPGWIRTPKAKELAKLLFDNIRRFLDGILKQYKDIGLLPYPFPGDFG